MDKRELLCDGKAKQIYATDDPNLVIIMFKDAITAYGGVKKSFVHDKGVLDNKISEIIYRHLGEKGIKTHFLKRIDDRNQLCVRAKVIPLKFVVRNVVAGSLVRRLNMDEGITPVNTIYEICLKNVYLRDPLINEYHAMAMGYATDIELENIHRMTVGINRELTDMFKKVNINVIDFEVEFGYDAKGELMLIDEISPDTARFWDSISKQKLDKDRFRRDLGKVEEAYREVLNRLEKG